jgi:hypothetical protein
MSSAITGGAAVITAARKAATVGATARESASAAVETTAASAAVETTAASAAMTTAAMLGEDWDWGTHQSDRSDCREKSVRKGGLPHESYLHRKLRPGLGGRTALY